jgi:hypothetical protein
MSKGAGSVERQISDLFAATRDRALSIDDITDHAFGLAGAAPTRAQRLSATRAAHRVVRRTRASRRPRASTSFRNISAVPPWSGCAFIAASGTRIVYRSGRSATPRLGGSMARLR